jgi:SAM-dependent methyltransferase
MLIPDDSKVLDVGCGTFFSKNFLPWNLWGIEPSSKMVELFINKNPDKKDRIVVGFADNLLEVYEKEEFDALICVSVAHHFKNPLTAFKEMSDVCKPFAKIGITLLRNTNNFHELEKEIKHLFNVVEIVDVSSSKDVVYICMNK